MSLCVYHLNTVLTIILYGYLESSNELISKDSFMLIVLFDFSLKIQKMFRYAIFFKAI